MFRDSVGDRNGFLGKLWDAVFPAVQFGIEKKTASFFPNMF
jgi:hypothetical protein